MDGREYTQVNCALWSDDDWRALTSDEQWLYFLLWTHPNLSAAGVLDWRPGKLSGFATDKSAGRIRELAASLQSKHFLLVDEDTEEVLVRPYIKRDRTRLSQPNTAKSMYRAFSGTGSGKIRRVLVHELRKVFEQNPSLKGFTSDNSKDDLKDMMRQPSAPISTYVDLIDSSSDVDPDREWNPSTLDRFESSNPSNEHVPTRDGRDRDRRSSQGHAEGQGSRVIEDGLTEAGSAEIALLEPEEAGSTVEDIFEQFWEHWPRKVKKPDASKAFKRAVKDKRATPGRIVQGAEVYSRSRLPEKRFIPHPATWLNNDQWNDLDAQPAATGPVGMPTASNPGAFTNWSQDDYRPWHSRPHVIEAQERVDDARGNGKEPTGDDLRIIAGPDGG